MPRGALARLLAHAAAHHGLVRRSEARSQGWSDAALRSLVRAGVLATDSRRVFRVVGAPRTWRQSVLAAVWAAGPGAVAIGPTAAVLHGFDGHRPWRGDPPGPIHVLMEAGSQSFRRSGVRVHRTNQFLRNDRSEVDGIPVADPMRTWLSLCAAARPEWPERVEDALDGAERDGLITRHRLVRRLELWRIQGRNGVRVAATLLLRRERLRSTPRSVIERRLLRILDGAGIKSPECQVRVRRPDGSVAFLDAAWRPLRYGIETDGNVAHATPRQRASDARRSNALVRGDYVISRFTYEQIMHEPEYVASTVRATITTRARALGLQPSDFGCPG